jgi:magnesium-transporting ATPase (P-type)
MTITALLWGNEGEYLVPIHDHEQNTALEDKQRRIGQKRPSLDEATTTSAMKDLILGACLCNNAVKQASLTKSNSDGIDNETPSQMTQIVGDAADVALYNLCNDKCSVDIEQVKKVNPRINSVPFNSKNKFMITANILEQTSTNDGNDATVLVTLKGAPDFVLSRCSCYKHDTEDEILPMTDEFRCSIQQRQETLGKSGYRVIAMLQQKMSMSQYSNFIEAYKASKRQQQKQLQVVSDEPDLNGLPSNNYCFVGK